MNKIIIVEDSETIRLELKEFLEKYGYEVTAPDDFNNIVDVINKENGDLILLDINLPVYDGYYICREIRKISSVPIIIVTSRNSEIDELMSMNIGADDFVTKPYNTQILLARIEAILKRTYGNRSTNDDNLEHNGLKLNLSTGFIENIKSGKKEEITKNEMKILSYLMKNKEKIVSREDLMNYLWSTDFFVDDNTLSVNITRLRKKLELIEIYDAIETRRGLGYIMP
ncbi:response regulator transcription factor [Clostridium mediterraneense]|uniref:response regulator transcription factor n=1 Tax=Clostridium mediterraneense TaxID=1805472 RepID=UPI00082C2B36|nr:response regulator transcription factor [Clostridium mediterraneense]